MEKAAKRREAWETWASAWRAISSAERASRLAKCFAESGSFVNPLFQGQGLKELTAMLEEFQARRPGAYFETVEFLAHHDVVHAKWEMTDGHGLKIGAGYNVAEYDRDDKIVNMKGFFLP